MFGFEQFICIAAGITDGNLARLGKLLALPGHLETPLLLHRGQD
jgi:hypothetical protein